MLSKKGQAEMQFHWIYVILAGTLILMVIGYFIFQHQKITKENKELERANELSNTLKSINSKQGLTSQVENIHAEYDCSQGKIKLQTGEANFNEPFFTKSKITGQFQAASIPLKKPYRVTNLLIGKTSEQNIIIYYDDKKTESAELYAELMKYWPSEIPFETNSPTKKDNSKILYLETSGTDGIRVEGGKIIFGVDNIDYIGTASIIGALFAEDKTQYECAMGKVVEREANVGKVYNNKINAIKTYITSSGMKEEIKTFCITRLNTIQSKIGLTTSADDIQIANKELQEKGCPVVY